MMASSEKLIVRAAERFEPYNKPWQYKISKCRLTWHSSHMAQGEMMLTRLKPQTTPDRANRKLQLIAT